jgi:hypothetical protein
LASPGAERHCRQVQYGRNATSYKSPVPSRALVPPIWKYFSLPARTQRAYLDTMTEKEMNPIVHQTTDVRLRLDPKMDTKDDSDVMSATVDDEMINEKRVLRKIDFRLLPIVVALHATALVDRTNISVAMISGMTDDLSLDIGSRVSIVTSTFFIGYILFNIPSNLLIRGVGAARFLGVITFAWGLVTIGIGFVNSWVAAAVLRSLLGCFEAG